MLKTLRRSNWLSYAGQSTSHPVRRCSADLTRLPSTPFVRWELAAQRGGHRGSGEWQVWVCNPSITDLAGSTFAERPDLEAGDWALVKSFGPVALNAVPGGFHHRPRFNPISVSAIVPPALLATTPPPHPLSYAFQDSQTMRRDHRDMVSSLERLAPSARGPVMTLAAKEAAGDMASYLARLSSGACFSVIAVC